MKSVRDNEAKSFYFVLSFWLHAQAKVRESGIKW